jgi:murein DD-endopeptidase MepM/ murein hydrolase activator NlpD
MNSRRWGLKGSLFITFLIIIPTLFFLSLISIGTGLDISSKEIDLPVETASQLPVQATIQKPTRTLTGTFKRNTTFCATLAAQDIPRGDIMEILSSSAPVYDLANVKAGNRYNIVLDDSGSIHSFRYAIDEEQILSIRRMDDTFQAEIKHLKLVEKVDALEGHITSSLFETVKELNESPLLALMMADIFAWDIDFYTDLQKGDIFNMVFEKKFFQGEFVKYGKILGAKFLCQDSPHIGIWFEDPEGNGDYYDPEGQSLRKAFLKSPLKYTRISSSFSYRRYHPILKTYRPHLGVDYAAPSGTPVQAIGDGTIIYAGYSGQEGRMVKIRHNSTYTSYYLHLSRFANGIKKGRRVQQGDLIGYVGSTGLSTGPHLDFRVKKNNSFVNPLKIKSDPAAPVKPEYFQQFAQVRDKVMQQLSTS